MQPILIGSTQYSIIDKQIRQLSGGLKDVKHTYFEMKNLYSLMSMLVMI